MEIGNVRQPPPRCITTRGFFFALLILSSLATILHNLKLELSTRKPSEQEYEPLYGSDLERALAKTATEDKTLIITFLSRDDIQGKRPIFNMFLEGFLQGEGTQDLKNHLLVAAVDKRAYLRCKFYGLPCYMATSSKKFDGERWYTPDEFLDNILERTLFLANVLSVGYNFIFTDTDVIWLRNPFPILLHSQKPNETVDMQISVDRFNGNQSSADNSINTGFYMVKSNFKTILLFYDWVYRILTQKSVTKEQDALQTLLKEGHLSELGLKVRFLNTLYFSGFCEHSKDVRVVATVHANCCRDVRAKVKDLDTVLDDWNRFKSSPGAPFKWSKHRYCKLSRNDSNDF